MTPTTGRRAGDFPPGSPAEYAPRVLAPHDPRAPRALIVLPALVAACTGRGAEAAAQAAEGFGEAMRTVVIILLVFAAIGAVLYLSIWAWFVAGWRKGQAPWLAALLLVLAHAGALLMAGDEPDELAYPLLWWSAPLPAAALAIAVAARLPARLGVGALVSAGLCLLPARAPTLRSLPAPVVDLSSAFIHACVVLRNGELACAGDQAAGCGLEVDAPDFAPRRVSLPAEVERVQTASGLTCVHRRGSAVSCCGGSQLPAPRTPAGPWELPIGRPGSTLAITATQILARSGDDLEAWPHPLPAGLRGARAFAVSDGIDDHFAVVDRAGELWMWQQDGAAIIGLARFEGFADAEEVAVQDRTGACVRRTSGVITCVPWPESRDPRFDVPDLRAAQLVALDDAFDSFCARKPDGAVVCWSEDDPPRPFAELPRATRLVSTNSALCDLAAAPRCVPVMHDIDHPLADLLALPVEP